MAGCARRWVATVTGVAVLAGGFLGGPAPAHGQRATPAPAAERLGFYPGYADLGRLGEVEGWLGRPVGHVVQFADSHSWSRMTSSTWGQLETPGKWQTLSGRLTMVLTVPLNVGTANARTAAGVAAVRDGLRATASGANDGAFRLVARRLREGGYPDAIIRLGHEFDGDWYPWSVRGGNCADFVAAWRHVHGVFRAVSPRFRFDYNGSLGDFDRHGACAWPGDAYVDIVGLDLYDRGFGAPWDPASRTWRDPAAVWRERVLPGLRRHHDFAAAHGKPVSYPEWALSGGGTQTSGNAGGDNPVFIEGMHAWLSSLPADGPGSLAYHAYFLGDPAHSGPHSLEHFPRARQRFHQLFGVPARAAAGGGEHRWPVVRPRGARWLGPHR